MRRASCGLSVLVLGAVVLAGCSPDGEAAQPPLQSTTWTLAAIGPEDDPSPALAGSEVTIEFDAGEVSGSAGCNLYFGGYSDEPDGTFSVANVAWTERACMEPGIMEQEQLFLSTLVAAGSYQVAGGTLTIAGNGNVLVFSQIA
jgi:heat shock protein HslJ